MKWTFGIITAGNNPKWITKTIESIHLQNIQDDYEIIVIGGFKNIDDGDHIHFPFNESHKKGWITRKKNLIAQHAKYPNLSITHDYVTYLPGWWKGFEEFGEDFDVAMCQILNKDDTRFRSWCLFHRMNGQDVHHLDFDVANRTHQMYVSGTYMIVKKNFFLDYPLNESLGWAQGEDCVWSFRVRSFWKYKMNKHAKVKFLKQKPPYPPSDQIVK